MSVNRQVAELVDEPGVVLVQAGDLGLELALDLGQIQGFDQCQCGGQEHPVAGLDGLVCDALGPLGLADAGWADDHQVGALIDEAEVQQGVDLALGDGGLMAAVESLQALGHGEVAGSGASLRCFWRGLRSPDR